MSRHSSNLSAAKREWPVYAEGDQEWPILADRFAQIPARKHRRVGLSQKKLASLDDLHRTEVGQLERGVERIAIGSRGAS